MPTASPRGSSFQRGVASVFNPKGGREPANQDHHCESRRIEKEGKRKTWRHGSWESASHDMAGAQVGEGAGRIADNSSAGLAIPRCDMQVLRRLTPNLLQLAIAAIVKYCGSRRGQLNQYKNL